MSARLGYPLPSSAPEASARAGAPDKLLQGNVEVADLAGFGESSASVAGATSDDESAGTWLGRVHPNKYTGDLGLEDVDLEEAQRLAVGAGLPYFSSAKLAEIQAELQNDPRLDELKITLSSARHNPQQAKSRAWQLTTAMVRDRRLQGNDVWAVLILALRHALIDQGEQLRYTLDRLQMYGAMGQQMSKYGTVLLEVQRALDLKLSNEKDKLKQAFVEVPFNDQREYDAESFYALLADGGLHYKQHAAQAQTVPEAGALQAKEAEGYVPLWKFGLGKPQQHFKTGDGKSWLGRGKDEPTRRADVIKQISGKYQGDADAANLVSTTGLGLKVQNYTQQREQLQKLTEKWQTRFQMDHEVKNQTASAIHQRFKEFARYAGCHYAQPAVGLGVSDEQCGVTPASTHPEPGLSAARGADRITWALQTLRWRHHGAARGRAIRSQHAGRIPRHLSRRGQHPGVHGADFLPPSSLPLRRLFLRLSPGARR